MEWFRLYHGTVSDKKWPLIARKSGQPKHVVVAVWLAILECASESDDRGSVEDFDPEEVDAVLDLDDGASGSVFAEMVQRGIIKDGYVVAWERRQQKRPEDNSTDRVRAFRERKKAIKTQCNERETHETAGETQRNAGETGNGTENRTEQSIYCSELATPQASEPEPVATLPQVNPVGDYPISQADVDEWQEAYPGVDVLQALKQMRTWLKANPEKRKTPKGMRRFVNNWLGRDQNSGKNSRASPSREPPAYKQPPTVSDEEAYRMIYGKEATTGV